MKTFLSLLIGWLGFITLVSLIGCNQSDPPAPQSNNELPEALSPTLDFRGLSDDPKTQIMKDKYKKIVDGKGMMTEKEVVALLGPDFETTQHDGGVVGKTWDNSTWIRIEFKEDRANDLSVRISPQTESKKITEDQFKKLRRGMTQEEINGILGCSPNMGTTTQEGNPLRTWRKANVIQVFFKDGKVDGNLWVFPQAD